MQETSKRAEEYICALYRSKKDSADIARWRNKREKIKLSIPRVILPPYFTFSYLQMKRANFVAFTWKKTGNKEILLPNIDEHGWQADGSIDWIKEPYPDGIYNLLIEQNDIKTDSEESDFHEIDTKSDEDGP